MKLSKDSRGEIAGYMGPGTEVKGELRFKDSVRIDGRFHGVVESAGTLLVGEGGQVEAEIKIGKISVSGSVQGSIAAAEKVEILHNGKVIGDISTPVLVVEEGAVLEGKCSMVKRGAVAAPKATAGVAALEIKQ